MDEHYQLELPDYPRWIKGFAWFIAVASITVSVVCSIIFRRVSYSVFGLIGTFLPVYFRQRTGSPLPSKLAIKENHLIAYDFPELDSDFTRGINQILPECSFDLDQSNFEWIDGWLFLNQHKSGSSIKLCQDADPAKLSKWLQSHGYQTIGS